MPGKRIDWPETVIASEATTKNQPPETDIIMFHTSVGTACGTSSRQKRCQAERWYIRDASISSTGTVRSDWYRLNVMFHACEGKIAINPVTVIDRNPRIGTDCSTSRTGIRIFSACRLLAASAA